MTLISDLIRSALRESNLIAASADPSAMEVAEGVTVLNQFIPSLFGHEAGEEFVDRSITTASYTARPNERLLVSYTVGNVTITLPDTPDNGARVQLVDLAIGASRTVTITGSRKVGGAANAVLAAGFNRVYMYRADLGDWAQIAPLASTDALPFPSDYEPLFIAALAIRINGRNGQEVPAQLQAVFTRDIERIKFDYRQTGQQDEPRTKVLLNRALKIAGLIPDGGQPRAAQITDALRRLNAAINSLFGEELGERLHDETFQCFANSGGSVVPINTRLVGPITASTAIKLPSNPLNGSRFGIIGDFASAALAIDGNGRDIEGGSSIVVAANDVAREWFYRSDLGQWVRLAPLTVDDVPPFPEEFDSLLEAMTAIRLSPDAISDTLVASTRRMLSQFKARYRQSVQMPSEWGLLRLPLQDRRWRTYSNVDEFNHGEYFWRYFP